jgi:carbonic anhydrase/acetyltransferase-like protein (isoleucine patch superfamily)
VLKGDLGPVRLGAFSNVQERCVIDAAGCVEQIPRFSKTPTVSARARVPRKGSDGRREATRAPTRGDPRGSRRVDPKSTKSVDGSGRVRCRLQRLFAKKRVFFHTESPPEPLFPNCVQTPTDPDTSLRPSRSLRSAATRIGQYVTVGTCTSISSAVVEDNVLVGARSVLGAGSYVEANAALEAGTVVEPGQLIPSGQLWGGNPARYVRDLDGNEVLEIQTIAKNVYGVAADHADQQTPWGLDYVQAEALRRALGRE